MGYITNVDILTIIMILYLQHWDMFVFDILYIHMFCDLSIKNLLCSIGIYSKKKLYTNVM